MRIVCWLLTDPAKFVLTCLTDAKVLPVVPPDVIRLALWAHLDVCFPIFHLRVFNASHARVILVMTFETCLGEALLTLDEAYVEVFRSESLLALYVRADSHQRVFIQTCVDVLNLIKD